MKDKYPLLFSPKKMGSLKIKNRIVFLPHYPALETDDGTIKDTYINYYAERAKGGAGLLITESYAVHPLGKTGSSNLEAWDKKALPGYKRMSAEAHKYGSMMFAQLSHGGHYTVAQPPQLLIAPTQMSEPGYHYNTKEMEIEDIKSVVQSFANSAKYVREGGFDGVEIKGAAHDGILRSFISPYFNRRKDEYGGSFENRMRLPLEVVHAIRESVGPDFIFGVRVVMDEFTPWGYGLEEGKRIVKAFADSGEVDYIDTDAGCFSSFYMEVPPMSIPLGFAEYLSAEMKKTMNLPVIAFGRINDPVQAEKILADGSADFIGMARQLVCDPEFAIKLREGREDEIRHCIACQDGCIYQVMQDKPIRCIQNPAVGREAEFGIGTLRQANKKKDVLIVGGGPAGLKAAEIAARRGHRVSIYEKNEEFGGQVKIAAKIPFREEVSEVVRHLVVQIENLGVDIHLKEEATAEKIIELGKDTVIIATGSFPAESDIPGSEQPHVVTVWDVLLDRVPLGDHVVIYDITRRWPGLGTAEFLANQGKRVEILSPSLYVGQQIEPSNISLTYQRLLERDAVLIPSSELKEIRRREVVIANVYSQKQQVIEEVDNVVMSVGNSSNRELYDNLKGEIKELYCVGDALAPRLIQQVIFESEMLGRKI
jgi:mycofactocin system FadH/OYE family oxidoreductase 2